MWRKIPLSFKFNAAGIKKLNGAIDKAFKETVEVYGDECKAAIESPTWEWDGITHRRNGEIASSPRDILDLGNLRDSQAVEFTDPSTATVTYDVDYAAAVHDGHITSNGSIVTGRPWTEEAARNTDFEGIMAAELRKQI
jgi:hypothetical protein